MPGGSFGRGNFRNNGRVYKMKPVKSLPRYFLVSFTGIKGNEHEIVLPEYKLDDHCIILHEVDTIQWLNYKKIIEVDK